MTVMAERAGLSQQSVSYVEREMRVPNLDTLLRLTGVLGLNIGELLKIASNASPGRDKK